MKRKEFFTNGLLLLASVLLVLIPGLVAIEYFYIHRQLILCEEAWHDPNTRFDPELGWAPVPNRKTRFNDDYGAGLISSNSLGFRSEEPDERRRQVIVLGDSVAWGYGVSDEQTLVYHLERLAIPIGRQVCNLAVSGYDLGQYYLFLKKNIGYFKNLERVILVLYAGNDLEDTGRNYASGKRKPMFRVESGELRLTGVPIRKYCLRNFLFFSATARLLWAKFPPLTRWIQAVSGDEELATEERTRVIDMLLEKINTLVTEHKGRLTIVLSPSRDDFDKPSPQLTWLEKHLRSLPYDFLDYFAMLKNLSLHNAGKDPRALYLDGGHYHDVGNRFLAEVLFEYLWGSASERLASTVP